MYQSLLPGGFARSPPQGSGHVIAKTPILLWFLRSLGPGAKEKAPALESNRGRSLRASIQRHPLQVKNEHELNARYIARVPAGLVIFSPQQVARNPWRYSPLCAGKKSPGAWEQPGLIRRVRIGAFVNHPPNVGSISKNDKQTRLGRVPAGLGFFRQEVRLPPPVRTSKSRQ